MEQGCSRVRLLHLRACLTWGFCAVFVGQVWGIQIHYLATDARAASSAQAVEFNFHEVSGNRLQRLNALLDRDETDGDFAFLLSIVAVLFEPMRATSHYFQTCAEGHLRHGRPQLADICWGPTSGLTQVAQYFSSLAAGEVKFFRMVWQHNGCKTFGEWLRTDPKDNS